MPSHDYLELDVERVLKVCEGRIDAVASADRAFTADLLGRLPPSRWTLEWFLPWWLGAAFGLDEAIAFEIVTSNVLGLGSIRVQDDVADDEVDAADLETAARSGRSSIGWRSSRIGPGSRADPRFGATSRRAWRPGAAPTGAWQPAVRRSRSRRSRPASWRIGPIAIRHSIDAWTDALTGLALYDDLADWRADLAAGRWNSFVAQATAESDPARVVLAMLTDEAVARQTDRIVSEMSAAAVGADELGMTPLADHLRAFGSETEVQGAELQAHYREIATEPDTCLSGAATEPTGL